MTYHIPVFTRPQIELLLGEGVGFPYIQVPPSW